MKTWAICYYTFRESLARKTFVAFLLISTIILAFFLFALNIEAVDGALASLSIFGTEEQVLDVEVRDFVRMAETGIAIFLYTVGLFFSVFATAGLIPATLSKGNIDWLLAKPISRTQLMIGKFLGAMLIVAFNVFYLILGSWLILSAKTGVWHFAFVQSGLLILVIFAVLYALMALLGVVWQNSAICIMGVFLFAILGLEAFRSDVVYALVSGTIARTILDVVYYITPRVFETGEIVKNAVLDKPIASWQPLLHSLMVGTGYFAMSVLVVKNKNF